ncbi:MAG TPA: adenylate/guanylate cyclase domain-containing protein [Burkholderiaceae bacterium]
MSSATRTPSRLARLLPKHGWRWLLGLLLTLLGLTQADGNVTSTVVERLDLFFYDTRLRVQAPELDPRIVIVDIDTKSIAAVGRFPWGRDKVAQLVTQMGTTYGARAIGFDIMFAEPDTSSGYATLEALARKDLKDIPAVAKKVEALKTSLDYDGRLAAAIEGQPVVLGYFFGDEAPTGQLPKPAFTTEDLNGRTLDALPFTGYAANLPQLQNAAPGAGFFNTDFENDGRLRASPLMVRSGNAYYESLALATVRVALGASAVKPEMKKTVDMMSEAERTYGALEKLNIYIRRPRKPPLVRPITVEHNLMARIDYRGRGGPAGGAFRYVSAVDIMRGTADKDMLENTIMLVGTSAAGLNDLRSTPVRSDYPGVEVHANLIKSILDGEFKVKPDFTPGIDTGQILLCGLVLTVVLPLVSPAGGILLAAGAAIAVAGFNHWMYASYSWVLPMAATLLLILLLFVVNLAWGYLFEYRNRQAIVNLFGEYVAPELVAEMANNPQQYNMEGESRELTVMFSDVRGFTTISEGLSPNELREYINRYLTAMSEDIRGNRGTLDKYIGDAVMAFWGAPVALQDHAARAVATALTMQRSCVELNREFAARGWPALHIGIGLSTGQMRVGDMGSKVRRAYTVMGDAVNLGARLEGITKVYGVGIIVGDATRSAAPQYAYRELDRVRVKGKNEPVPIFEPLGLVSECPPAQLAELERWHAALAAVRSQQWDAAETHVADLLRESPEFSLYVIYLKRIAYFKQHPPGPDWDGVTTFETK